MVVVRAERAGKLSGSNPLFFHLPADYMGQYVYKLSYPKWLKLDMTKRRDFKFPGNVSSNIHPMCWGIHLLNSCRICSSWLNTMETNSSAMVSQTVVKLAAIVIRNEGWSDTLMHRNSFWPLWIMSSILLAAHVRKVCNFFFAHHLRVYSRISGFLPLLRKREIEIPWNTLESYAVLYFPNAKLGTCCGWAWLLRWKRAWPSVTNPCALTMVVKDSQRWGLSMMDVWKDSDGTAWSSKWQVIQKNVWKCNKTPSLSVVASVFEVQFYKTLQRGNKTFCIDYPVLECGWENLGIWAVFSMHLFPVWGCYSVSDATWRRIIRHWGTKNSRSLHRKSRC